MTTLTTADMAGEWFDQQLADWKDEIENRLELLDRQVANGDISQMERWHAGRVAERDYWIGYRSLSQQYRILIGEIDNV